MAGIFGPKPKSAGAAAKFGRAAAGIKQSLGKTKKKKKNTRLPGGKRAPKR